MATTRFIDIRIRSRSAERNINRLDRRMTGLGRAADNTARSMSSLSKVAIGVFSGIALNAVTKYADAFSSIQNQIRQTTKTTEDLTDRTAELLDVANRSRVAFGATAELYTQLTLATEDLNLTTEEQLRLTETISKSFAVSGKTAAESAGAIRQLGQAFSAGALRGDEFNSIAENAPEIMRALKRETGLTAGELRDFAATGGITAEILVNALGNAADVIDEKMNKAVKTFAQSMQEANNNMTAFIGSSSQVQNIVGGAGEALITASDNIESIAKFAALTAAVFVSKLAPSAIVSAKAILSSASASTVDAKAKVTEATAIKVLTREEVASTAVTVTKSRRDLVATITTKQKAIETVKAARAANSEAIATLEAARASVIHARATSQLSTGAQVLAFQINNRTAATIAATAAATALTKAELAASASSANLTATKVSSAAAISAAATAKTASAIAATRLTAANNGMALSTRLAATAARGLTSAMALIGGPLGAALLAATAIFLFVDAAEDAEDRSKRLSGELDTLKASFVGLTEAQRLVSIDKLNIEMRTLRSRLQLVNEQLATAESSAIGGKGRETRISTLRTQAQGLNDDLDQASIKQQALFGGGLPEITGETEGETGGAKPSDEFTSKLIAETELLRLQLQLRQAVKDGFFTQEESEEVERFNATLTRQAGIFQQELTKLGEDELAKEELRSIFREAQLLAVEEFQANLTGIEAEGGANRLALEQDVANQAIAIKASVNQQAVGLARLLVGNSKKAAIALIAVEKGLGIAQTIVNSQVAATKALAVLGPIAGPPAAASILTFGKISAGLIAATGLAQAASLGGSSPSVGGGGGGQQAPTATAQELPQQTRAIDIRIDDNALLTGAMFKEALNSVLESDSDIAINISNAQAEAVRTGAI